MEFKGIDQLKAVQYLNNLDVIERSLYKEFELGKIAEIKFNSMLLDVAEQRCKLYKALEAITSSIPSVKYKSNVLNKPPLNEN